MQKALLAVLIIISLVSCKASPTINLENSLSFTAECNWAGNKTIMDGITENDAIHLTVKSPEYNKNFKITLKGNEVTFYYLELEKAFPLNSLPSTSPLRVIFEGFTQLKSGTAKLQSSDNRCFAEFKADGGKYIFNISPAGLPLDITDGESNSVIFKGVTIIS